MAHGYIHPRKFIVPPSLSDKIASASIALSGLIPEYAEWEAFWSTIPDDIERAPLLAALEIEIARRRSINGKGVQ